MIFGSSELFHVLSSCLGPSLLPKMAWCHTFGWLSDIPLNMCTTSSFSFHNSGEIFGYFCVLAPGNRAAKKAGCTYLFQPLFDLDVRPSVGMLDHSISASLGFQETSMLVPQRLLAICVPSPAGGAPVLQALSSTDCRLSDDGHSGGWKVISLIVFIFFY